MFSRENKIGGIVRNSLNFVRSQMRNGLAKSTTLRTTKIETSEIDHCSQCNLIKIHWQIVNVYLIIIIDKFKPNKKSTYLFK